MIGSVKKIIRKRLIFLMFFSKISGKIKLCHYQLGGFQNGKKQLDY